MQIRRHYIKIVAIIVALFGVLTVLSGGRVLFGGPEIRASAGAVVLFVLWFNFLAGFAYIATGICFFLRKAWAVRLSIAIFFGTVLVFVAFGGHVLLGGAYEMRTVWAMSLRTVVWGTVVSIAIYGRTELVRKPQTIPPETVNGGAKSGHWAE